MALVYNRNNPMGITWTRNACFKYDYRFLFEVEGINSPINAMPPLKSQRPSYQVKTKDFEHVSETISFPVKMQHSDLKVTLYDVVNVSDGNGSSKAINPVYDWLATFTDPKTGVMTYPLEGKTTGQGTNPTYFKRNCAVHMLSGCGDLIESWVYANAFPINLDLGSLDMGGSEIMTVDVTLKYDRAFIY